MDLKTGIVGLILALEAAPELFHLAGKLRPQTFCPNYVSFWFELEADAN